MQQVRYLEAIYDSPLQRESIDLRDRILRKPLGLQFSEVDLKSEHYSHHLVALYRATSEEPERLVACLVLKPLEGGRAKVRQVAVDASIQGAGLGRGLSEFSESFALGRGFVQLELHARETAVGFYEKLGYQVEGERFEEVGIPHFRMVKMLSNI